MSAAPEPSAAGGRPSWRGAAIFSFESFGRAWVVASCKKISVGSRACFGSLLIYWKKSLAGVVACMTNLSRLAASSVRPTIRLSLSSVMRTRKGSEGRVDSGFFRKEI